MNKYLDENGLLYLWGKIKTFMGGKVDKEAGKGLSSNDFTAADKAKLDGLGDYVLPVADVGKLGGIMVGYRDPPGTSSDIIGSTYFLALSSEGLARIEVPYASANKAGVVKVGAGLDINNGVLSATGGGTADSVDWSNIQNKPDLALKEDLTSLYRYKGSVTNYASLPSSGNVTGDVWNVEATGMNYAWTGEDWDALGQTFQIQTITNAEIDAIISGG